MLGLLQSCSPLSDRAGVQHCSVASLMSVPSPSGQTVSKYNSQYHKLFQTVPKEEILMKGEGLRVSYADILSFFVVILRMC